MDIEGKLALFNAIPDVFSGIGGKLRQFHSFYVGLDVERKLIA